MIANYILNSRIINLLPFKIVKFIFKRIVYFEQNLDKKYQNNYKNNYLTEIKLRESLTNLKKYKDYSEQNKKYQILNVLISTYFKKNKFKLLDYGSGNIENFFYLSKFFPKMTYFYHDKKENNFFYKKIKKKYKIKNFEVYNNQKTDIIYFGSSLQYIPDLKLINKIYPQNSKIICITETPLITDSKYKNKKILITQKNMLVNINSIFHSKYQLIKYFKSKNFKLIFESNYSCDPHINFKNLNFDCSVLNFIFIKK